MSHPGIAGLVILILLAGFFAGIMVAFTRINRLRIEIKKKQGKLSGRILSRFQQQPGRFILISIIGLVICLVVYCILLGRLLDALWDEGSGSSVSPYLRLLAEVVVSAVILLIFGLLIPRSLFRAKADRLLVVLALPIAFFSYILYPLGRVMTSLSLWMLKYLFNVRIGEAGSESFQISDPEMFILNAEAPVAGRRNLSTELFENALELPKVKIRECMVPRKEVEAVGIGAGLQEVTKRFIDTRLSKLIIYEGNIDNILGYVHQLDLFASPSDLRSLLHPLMAVPETMSAIDLLGRFTRESKSIAWVVDEFGGTAGIVTLEDLLEEVFGEIRDEHDLEDEFVEKQTGEKEFIFSGRLEIDYLNEKYGFGFRETESETLSGFIIAHHEAIPRPRTRIIVDEFEFDILNVTETRIELVRMRVLR